MPLLIGSFGGCTDGINRWRLSAPADEFHPTESLCALQGKRLAIVPGRSLIGNRADKTASLNRDSRNWQTVPANGNLSIHINDGNTMQIDLIDGLQPESIAQASSFFQDLGFEVIDRSHVAKILEEHDIQAVFGKDAQRVGGILGADVLVVASLSATPIVYFAASGSGAYAAQPDFQFRAHEDFVSVRDGSYLGSWSFSGSHLALCGHEAIEARSETGMYNIVTFYAGDSGNRWTRVGDIDLVAGGNRFWEQRRQTWLRQWHDFCKNSPPSAQSSDSN